MRCGNVQIQQVEHLLTLIWERGSTGKLPTALDSNDHLFGHPVGETILDVFAHRLAPPALHSLSELSLYKLEDESINRTLSKDQPSAQRV